MLTIAHRGASAVSPENTLAAFREAVRAGADLIELDLRLSRDGEVVIFHDCDLDRTTGGQGPVGEKTLAELKQLDAGSWFSPEFSDEKIPTLAETLDAIGPAGVGLCLELKIDRGEEDLREDLVVRTLEVIEKTRFPGRLVPASFDLQAVRLVRSRDPNLETGLIFRAESVWDLPEEELAGVDILSARWNIVTADRVAAARRQGRGVWAWTVGRPEELARVRASGVEALAANDPAWLINQLKIIKTGGEG